MAKNRAKWKKNVSSDILIPMSEQFSNFFTIFVKVQFENSRPMQTIATGRKHCFYRPCFKDALAVYCFGRRRKKTHLGRFMQLIAPISRSQIVPLASVLVFAPLKPRDAPTFPLICISILNFNQKIQSIFHELFIKISG